MRLVPITTGDTARAIGPQPMQFMHLAYQQRHYARHATIDVAETGLTNPYRSALRLAYAEICLDRHVMRRTSIVSWLLQKPFSQITMPLLNPFRITRHDQVSQQPVWFDDALQRGTRTDGDSEQSRPILSLITDIISELTIHFSIMILPSSTKSLGVSPMTKHSAPMRSSS